MNALSFGALCFSSLFTVIDPFAVAPVFTTVTQGRNRAETRRIAIRACIAALGVLVVFALFGAFVFKIFGITLDAFRIGGGIVFLLIGLPMLSSGHDAKEVTTTPSDPSVVPLGVPLIGGPGAITTVMLLMGQSTSKLHTTALFGALAIAMLATFGILLVAPRLISRLGKGGTELITKVMGLIIVVIGVQFVIDGLKPIAIEILQSAR
ncbi:MAG: NAAT family transporter [Polyangiaceae bacterium]|nr:NAAT family transporter [Polyangiaceae bacterium]